VWTYAPALLPQNIEVGLLGSEMLKLATDSGADVQASASNYMDGLYKDNQLAQTGSPSPTPPAPPPNAIAVEIRSPKPTE
jgi:hypothetical protein